MCVYSLCCAFLFVQIWLMCFADVLVCVCSIEVLAYS